MKEYYDVDHARMRLSSSIVCLDDSFVWIGGVDAGPRRREYRISYNPLNDIGGGPRLGYIPQQEVRTDNLSLGFTNTGRDENCYALFLERVPVRMYKEGLNNHNVQGVGANGTFFQRHQVDNVLISKSMFNTLSNYYPSFDLARDVAGKHGVSIAFGRNFAVYGRRLVYRRGLVVGDVGKDANLRDEFFYLKELLTEELN